MTLNPHGRDFLAWYDHAKRIAFAQAKTECGKLLLDAAHELAWRNEIERGHKLEIKELKAKLVVIPHESC